MKPAPFILSAILVLLNSGFSQGLSGYGLKVGVTAARTYYEYDPDLSITTVPFNETRLSPNVSFFVRFLDRELVDFEAQCNYLQKGGDHRFEITTPNEPYGTGEFLDYDIQYDYLQLQLGLRPKHTFSKFEIYSYLGGSADYLLEVKALTMRKDRLKDFVFGYAVGLGISFTRIFIQPVFFEIVYNPDYSAIYATDMVTITNKIWLLRTGFQLGKK